MRTIVAPRRADLPPGRLHLDARRRSAAPVPRLEARDGLPEARWDHYCELMILYLLGDRIADASDPSGVVARVVAPDDDLRAVLVHRAAADPLFVHQYSHAWVDFRGRREREPPHIDWFENSVDGDPRAQGVLPEPVGRVSRLHRTRLGNHGLRQPQGLRRVGRAAAARGDRRNRGARRRRPGR